MWYHSGPRLVDMARHPMDGYLEVLSNPYRRDLLIALLEHNQQEHGIDPIDLLTDLEETARTELEQVQSPGRDGRGNIERNPETDDMNRVPNWEEVPPVLQILSDYSDDLPEV